MADQVALKELFGGRAFVAVDTETTGLWALSNRIVEIGAVKFRLGEEKTETFQSLINPGSPMPLEVIAIHHITDEMVKDSPHALEVLPRFLEFLGDSMLVAHNAPFDISFIGCELDRNKLPLPESTVYDTVDIFHRLFPGFPSYSLLSLVHAFRIAETQEHRALADALQVRALMEAAGQRLQDFDNPHEVIQSFTVHRLSEWRGREIDLPAEFTDITVAIRHGLSLEILYASENSVPQRRIVHPKQVHARRANFYLLAYCELAQAERTFRLDRIQSFQLIESQL